MDELPAGGMPPQISLVAPGDARFAQQRKDPARDRQRPAFARPETTVLVEHVTVVVGHGVRPGFLRKRDRDDQQAVPLSGRDPRLAVFRAVAARPVLHDDDRLFGGVWLGAGGLPPP